jgi:hypothetical protein
MSRSLLLGLALAVGSLGCGNDPLAPLTDRYALISIASNPLPAVFTESPGATVRIIQSTLEFKTPTRGVERQRVRVTTPTDPTGVVNDLTLEFSYTIQENRVEITYDCRDTGSCIAGPHLAGNIVDGRLEFDVTLGRAPMIYRPN